MSNDLNIEGDADPAPPALDAHAQEAGEHRKAGSPPDSGLTFIGRNSALARTVGRPLLHFLHIETSAGILLLVATAAALIWVNSPIGDSYSHFWHAPIEIAVSDFVIFDEDLHGFVNDALMALFFFVVGLEIKREMVTGRLRRPRDAMLPAVAALGGMAVPALIYVGFNLGGDNLNGWGVPMATDIAFAMGVVSLVAKWIPGWLRLYLLTLAIVDDIFAILVIAVFYSSDISLGWLGLAALLCVLIAALTRIRVWQWPVYMIIGVVVWWATLNSGIHATIAGVALGLLTPARPLQRDSDARAMALWLNEKSSISVTDIRRANFGISESRSVAERLEVALHPYVSYLIVPVFALANAGVELSGDSLREAASSPVTIGVALGLLLGKTAGVSGFTILATRLGLSSLPVGVSRLHVLGAAIVAGIGFTVALFVTALAFEGSAAGDEAKIGVLAASLVAAVAGLIVLRLAGRRSLAALAPARRA
ncbi:MAG: Na+/H+ antiporter NhaA [bacterium]|nr:Na+/H+ antiporter NhaA [bacterium]MDE0668343.1 Na+/H+ antiporter NhaA [bacterium]